MRTDGQLLDDYAATGSEEAFREVVERHGPMVLAACRRLAGADAEDAVQAAFLLLARKARNLARERDVGPWLHRTVGFVAGRLRREEWRRRRREEEAAAMRETGGRTDRTGAAEAVGRELARHIDAAVAELPEAARRAVVLCYLEGLSQSEAAQRLGIPVGTVASRCERGLERLRARLARRGMVLGTAALGAMLAGPAARAAEDFAASGILPSILATAKLAAAGAAAGLSAVAIGAKAEAAGGISAAVLALAEGGLRAMFWMKVKLMAAVLVGAAVVGGGGAAVVIAAGEPAAKPPTPEVPPTAKETPAAAAAAQPGGKAAAPAAPAVPKVSYLKLNLFLKYMGLTGEQSAKIDGLYDDWRKGQMALANDPASPKASLVGHAAADPKAVEEHNRKLKALEDAFHAGVLAALTDEQKPKYQAAEKACRDFHTAIRDFILSCGGNVPQKALLEVQIGATDRREDALLKLFGEPYREQAERHKKAAKQGIVVTQLPGV